MTTILMFPYANHLGGTQPLVAVAERLRDDGHRIVFAARGKCARYVAQAGFAVEDVAELDPELSVAHINRSNLDYHTRDSVADFVAQETALIARHRPGAVIDLHRPTLGISARLTRTPRAVLCNTVLTRYYAGEKFLPESHPLSAIARYVPRRRLQPLTAWVEERLFERWARPYNAYLAGLDLPRIASMKDLFEGDATILMDAAELAPTVDLPAHVHTVGPLLHENPVPAPEWLARIEPWRKTIFVYLGSYGETFSRVVGYLGRMFAGADEYRVVAATAGLYRYGGPACPPNVTVVDYVPASAVLSRRCAAMITHGGRGSIYSALRHGVPLIGIPNQGEQEWNLDAAERLGIARKLSTKRLGFERFRDALTEVLREPGYRARAAEFETSLRGYDGVRAAADVVAALARQGGSVAGRPLARTG